MKTYDARLDYYNMWCQSTAPDDYVNPEMNDYLADEWRNGGETLKEAKENFFAHILENRKKGGHFRI